MLPAAFSWSLGQHHVAWGGTNALDTTLLAAVAEAFLEGDLAELLTGVGRPVAAWTMINRLAHSDVGEVCDLAAGDVSRAPLAGVSSGDHRVWSSAQQALALRLLGITRDPDELRQVRCDVLIPLELRLVALSRGERLTVGRVVADTVAALDHQRLDR